MIKFGPAGLADSFKNMGYKKSIQVADYLSQFGLKTSSITRSLLECSIWVHPSASEPVSTFKQYP